ncbi:fumarylacetoacetase [Edaphobacter modestus]|uniref:fumarylacetoacetase n=1 Tax=Edaphobacter modestus TaxID=388466 RepID=A0A4Q7YNY0_9BACT|nr:fumarylacetoacetase [Edaphobacter modestus]RZU39068.1 fumarylacetoacetate hydrolase [Edaphobacter modestus]
MAAVKESWVASANDPASDFSIHNLPYGVFRHQEKTRIGIAIGDQILDLRACAEHGLLLPLPQETIAACRADLLNPLMSFGPTAWSALRHQITALLDAGQPRRDSVEPHLIPMREAAMQLPAQIGDYTDFYASIHHATRVGLLFRPENPLLPNYKYVPIGYHGRASSIVISGENIHRPWGQIKSPTAASPAFGPTQSLDYELEVGIFVGQGNRLGQSIPIAEAEQHIFGLSLMNDWSARDIQAWEYQPLGPFLSKSFATTVSPWIVPLEALAPYRVPALARPAGDPAPLPYLSSPSSDRDSIDLTLEVYIESAQMRQNDRAPMLLSQGNLRDLYWTIAQLLTHHASNGCNLRPGDLLATGTVSGPGPGSEGCLLEKKHNPEPIRLPTGELRTFLEDGDRITFRAGAQKQGLPRIGFGECTGTILAP